MLYGKSMEALFQPSESIAGKNRDTASLATAKGGHPHMAKPARKKSDPPETPAYSFPKDMLRVAEYRRYLSEEAKKRFDEMMAEHLDMLSQEARKDYY